MTAIVNLKKRPRANAGRCYGVPAADHQTFRFPRSKDDSHIYCESRHGSTPHGSKNLNDHLDRVSCQACHIPRAGLDLPLSAYAFVHTAGAFALAAFVIGHVYLTTTGHTRFGALEAMVTGWEVVEEHSPSELSTEGALQR